MKEKFIVADAYSSKLELQRLRLKASTVTGLGAGGVKKIRELRRGIARFYTQKRAQELALNKKKTGGDKK